MTAKTQLDKQLQAEAAEAEWLAKLRDVSQKKGIFESLSQPHEGDRQHLKYVKKKLGKLLKQELDYLNFKEQLKKEEEENLVNSIYHEVITKKNFYFAIDENKKDTNLKIFNSKAPGNHHFHPSVILPHENVHIQRWINVKDMTPEKLTEIYAYYSQLIDLHIS